MERSSVTENAGCGGDGSSGGNGGEGGRVETWWGPPPFLRKTYEMVNDQETNSIISWNSNGTSFIVWDYSKFSAELLPKYFKTDVFSSFVYQLNNYGFRKISWERYEYGNPWFQAGKIHLLKNIKRRDKQPRLQKKRGFTPYDNNSTNATTMETKLESLLTEQNDMKEQIKKLKQNQKHMEDQLANLETNMTIPDPKDIEKQFLEYKRERKDEADGKTSKKPRLDDPPSTESSVDPTKKVEIQTQNLFSSLDKDNSGNSVQEKKVEGASGSVEHCPFWKKMLERDSGVDLNEQQGDLHPHHYKAIMELDERRALDMAIQTENLIATKPSEPSIEEEDVHLDLWT